MDAEALERRTFFFERWRAFFNGPVETFAGTFLLLIVIDGYHGGDTAQAVAATGGALGMLAAPATVWAVRRAGWTVTRAAAVLSWAGAALVALAAPGEGLGAFVACSLGALVCYFSIIPLQTELFQQNYPEARRGMLFSRTNRIRTAVVAVFSLLAGGALDRDMGLADRMLWTVAAALLGAGVCWWKVPARALQPQPGAKIFGALVWLWKDRTFSWIIGVYMLMGFGNLMMIPLRIKYMVEPQYGVGAEPLFVALVNGVIPPAVIFLTGPTWGKLFDKMNFFLLRAIINALFLVSNLAFFFVAPPWGFLAGAVLLGLSFSGGNVAWSLWVTKIAPPERVADYMSVHTFCTGIRALVAPASAVALAAGGQWLPVLGVSSLLIALSTLMLGPEIQTWRRRRASVPVAEQAPEQT